MKILDICDKVTADQWRDGIVPGHWLYGAVEWLRDGHDVVWAQESRDRNNDMRLVRRHKPDMVFIPNLNLHNHVILLAIASLGLLHIPVVGILHRTPAARSGLKGRLYRFLLDGLSKVMFLSAKTMEETIEAGLVDRDKCGLFPFEPDREFFAKVKTSPGERFVSTGKEFRDFDLLIDVFRETGAPLTIMTADRHAGVDHADLVEKCAGIPNIEVIITENSGNVYPRMLEAMANARALVCPLRMDKMNYCVGLSTIADAEGLGKPLLITRNPYHDPGRMRNFSVLDSREDWIKAINALQNRPPDNT